MSEQIVVKVHFGVVRLESRIRPEGNRLIGEGRRIEIDQNGVIVNVSPWEPMGVVAYWSTDPPRTWWKFWR
jgi:hypothetical protein